MSETLSAKEIEQQLGVKGRTLRDWVARGDVQRLGTDCYNVEDVKRKLKTQEAAKKKKSAQFAGDDELLQAKIDLTEAEARLKEMALKKRVDSYTNREELRVSYLKKADRMKQIAYDAIPKLVLELVEPSNPNIVERVLKNTIRIVLTRASEPNENINE